MSSVTKQVLIIVKQQGLDQVNTSIKGLTSTTAAATKSTTGLGAAFDKGQGNALNLRTGVHNLDTSEKKAVKTTTTFAKETDKAAKSTSGLAAKFQGNKGLIFATVGIATAGIEAVGMFQQYQNATAKVSEAQQRLTELQELGITSGREYTNAQKDLTDANRGAQFALRILTLSVGDLIPFTLLLINSAFKLKETLGGAKTAVDATAQATTALGNATKGAASGGMAQIASSAGTATTGLTNMGNSSKLTNTAIGGLTTTATNFDRGLTTINTRVQDATRLIGNNNSGLTGGYYGLSTGIDNSTKMSTKFKDAFAQIGTQIKALPNTLKGIGTSIASFFTNFGTHIGKLPGLFKTAGTAVLGFGKAITMALLSNPITAIIAGISAAVLALATDFGGVRTALNNVGVAIGNAIPPLKGMLQGIGDLINGGLDWIANQLGIKKSTDEVNKASSAAAQQGLKEFKDALVIPLQTSASFDKARQGLDKLTQGVGILKDTVIGAEVWYGNLTNSLSEQQKTAPGASQALDELNQIVQESEKPGANLVDIKTRLNATLTKLQLAVTGEEMAQAKSIQTTQKKQNATLGLSEAEIELSGQVALLRKEIESEDKVIGENAKNRENARKIVQAWIDDMGTANDFTDKQIASLIENAASLQMYGDKVAWASDGNIALGQTINNLVAENKAFEQAGVTAFGKYAQIVQRVGTDAIPTVQVLLEDLKNKHPEIAAVAQELWDNYLDNTVDVQGQLMLVNEAEEEQKEKVKSTAEEVAKKAKELKIYDQIQSLSLQNQQNAIKITEEQNKVENAAIMTLQKLATARGLDISQIGKSSTELLKHIAANNKLIPTYDEIIARTGELIAARGEDQKAAKIETLAQMELLASMDKSIPVVDMTGKGLSELVQIYDDTANATGIAADEIGTWYASLQKSQAVEDASIQKLLELADTLGVEIPDSAEMTVEGLKKVIEGSIDMGEQAKKSAEEAAKAFGDLANEAAGALENLIQEDLIKGDIDEVIEKIEEAGASVDTLSTKQAIIKPFLDDDDFTNDINGLSEIMAQEWAESDLLAKNGGDKVIQSFISGLHSHLGELGPPVVSHINNVWQQIRATNPGKTGADLVKMLAAELANPTEITTAANKLGGAISPGIQQGASGLPGTVNEIVNGGLSPLEQSVAKFFNGGKDLGAAVPEGTEQGAAPLSKILEPPINDLESLLAGSTPAFHQGGMEIGNEVVTGTEQGATPLPQTLESLLDTTSSNIAAKGPEFHSGGMTIGNEAVEGTATAIEGGASRVQNATLAGFNTPIMGAIGQIPSLAGTALAPLEGTAQGEFVKAQMAANSVISALLADINTSFGFLVQNVQQKLTEVSQAWITHSNNVKTISGQISTTIATITTAVTNFAGTAVKSLAGITATTTSTGNAFKTMGTSVSSGSSVGAAGVTNFTGIAGKGLGGIIAQAGSTGKAFTTMGSTISNAMKSAGTAASNFANSFKTAMTNTANSAKQAQNAVNALQKAINSLKGKSVYIGLTGPGARFMRHGGAFISAEPTGFAKTGTSFVNTKPRKIGGVNISEFGKPELVTVMPLSDPGNPMDKSIMGGMNVPKPQPIPHKGGLGGLIGSGSGGGQGQQPITVTGNMDVSVMLPDGSVIAKAVRPFLLQGFSGIT